MSPRLFEPLTLRGVTLRNRILMAPMCMWRAVDGLPSEWHRVHYGARAMGGFGMIVVEATGVRPEGRISPGDLGLWSEAQAEAFRPLTAFVKEHGSVPAVQLAHAGRKASVPNPLEPRPGTLPVAEGGWQTLAPSPVAFPGYAEPREMTRGDIDDVVRAFAGAARRALAAGFEAIQLHAAHGYLIHEFLSPLTNLRTDGYGATAEGRARLLLEVVQAVRAVWPEELPLTARFSATDWAQGGLEPADLVQVIVQAQDLGLDAVDISSGGLLEGAPATGPGYQVPLARQVRAGVDVPVSAVGLIASPLQAEQVLVEGSADAVSVGRAALWDPMWPLHAARTLGVADRDLWDPSLRPGASVRM